MNVHMLLLLWLCPISDRFHHEAVNRRPNTPLLSGNWKLWIMDRTRLHRFGFDHECLSESGSNVGPLQTNQNQMESINGSTFSNVLSTIHQLTLLCHDTVCFLS